MYLKNIIIKNIGPIDGIDIEMPFHDDNAPKPLVIVGKNGSGKSIVLSYIVDSLFNFQRHIYDDMGIRKDKLYKKQSPTYIKNNNLYGWVNLEYKFDQETLYSTEVLSIAKYDEFIEKDYGKDIPNFQIEDSRF